MARWAEIPVAGKLFTNVSETALRKSSAAIENAFINEAGGHTRFPGLSAFVTLTGNSPTYLHDWNGDLVAVTNSRVYRVSSAGVATDVTGVPLSGMGRATFAKTDDELLIAAGGPILRLAGTSTEILSADAPDATHVGYVDGYVVANEAGSGRFMHCESEDFRTWSASDTFAANGLPDDVNALVVTPYRELLVTGEDSVEQYERLTSGSVPFFRRWAVGQGVLAPYTLVSRDQGTWAINKARELVRIVGQSSEPISDDIGRTLEGVDDWTAAWADVVLMMGQKFIILQMPYATNVYGTLGITLLYEIRSKRWFSIFGWDTSAAKPTRWPGWSYMQMWGRHFVGGNGKVLELTEATYQNDSVRQRMLGRTGHIDKWGECEVLNVRVRVRRGLGLSSDTTPPKFSLRALKDNKTWTRWNRKSLGLAGDTHTILEFGPMGSANTWQFEWEVTDNCKVELVTAEALISPVENA